MQRDEIARAYWEAQSPTMQSMFQDERYRSLETPEREQILGCLPDLTNQRVLEPAAGIGRFTRELASRAAHVTAVDIAPQLIAANRDAHAYLGNIRFLHADVMSLTYADGSYDMIFINWLLMYLTDGEVESLVPRLRRWLKYGGVLFLRESCAEQTRGHNAADYVNYRTKRFYKDLLREGFRLIGESTVQIYQSVCDDPNQQIWLYQRFGRS